MGKQRADIKVIFPKQKYSYLPYPEGANNEHMNP